MGCVSHKHIVTFHGDVISAPNYCLVTNKCTMGKSVGWVGCVGCVGMCCGCES